jgi:sulfatase modifying factor 1
MLLQRRLLFSFLAISIASCIALCSSTTCRAAITIETVPIGNPANPPDTAVMTTDGTTGYGSVGYNYRIGKYDVTVGQYAAFLNAVAATDTYRLYYQFMAMDFNIAGIAQSGASGSYSYSVIGSPNHPITYVGWGDAARFVNWLHNGQPTGPEGPGTTETGAYTLNGATLNADLMAVSRNAGAKWFIPNENEWYKAAYYDPVAGHYWNYATGTNATPTSAPPGNIANTANYYGPKGYAVTGSKTNDNENYLTDVGAYTGSAFGRGEVASMREPLARTLAAPSSLPPFLPYPPKHICQPSQFVGRAKLTP